MVRETVKNRRFFRKLSPEFPRPGRFNALNRLFNTLLLPFLNLSLCPGSSRFHSGCRLAASLRGLVTINSFGGFQRTRVGHQILEDLLMSWCSGHLCVDVMRKPHVEIPFWSASSFARAAAPLLLNRFAFCFALVRKGDFAIIPSGKSMTTSSPKNSPGEKWAPGPILVRLINSRNKPGARSSGSFLLFVSIFTFAAWLPRTLSYP